MAAPCMIQQVTTATVEYVDGNNSIFETVWESVRQGGGAHCQIQENTHHAKSNNSMKKNLQRKCGRG